MASLICALIVAGAAAVSPRAAEAACVCRCDKGKPVAVCSRASDIRPICRSTKCPLSTPQRSPLNVRKPPPSVKPGCTVREVYNPQTRKHEWGQICD